MAEIDLYNIKRTALPDDTKKAIGEGSVDNFALLFNKMAHFAEKENIDGNDGNIEGLLDREIKAHFFHKSKKDKNALHLDLTEKWEVSNDFIRHYDKFRKDYAAAAEALFSNHEELILKANWRIAIGMGNESVYENGFTFHPTYGIPYLSGSSLKGMTRHWAVAEGKARDEIEAIFGTENNPKAEDLDFKQGQIIFFDAFPVELKKGCLQPDIMNNHYPDYYEGNKPPADWLSPRSIFFLTMKEVKFQFYLGCTNKDSAGRLNIAKKWLECALFEVGIGAKTAVGYGRFEAGPLAQDAKAAVSQSPEAGKREPRFADGLATKKLRNNSELEAIVTEAGRPCKGTVYGYGQNIYEGIKIFGNVQNLNVGAIIRVNIQTDNQGKKITQASLRAIIDQNKPNE